MINKRQSWRKFAKDKTFVAMWKKTKVLRKSSLFSAGFAVSCCKPRFLLTWCMKSCAPDSKTPQNQQKCIQKGGGPLLNTFVLLLSFV
jgi:hypothetical protein